MAIKNPKLYSDTQKRVSEETLYRWMPAAQHRSNERITESPFSTSNVRADSGRERRKVKFGWKVVWKQDICTLPKITPQILTNYKGKCTFLVERASSHQLCISNTETAGHYVIWNSQHHLWSSFGKNGCYRLKCLGPAPKIPLLRPNPQRDGIWR